MTDRDVNERLLRLNAALDGELDAMGSLEFERDELEAASKAEDNDDWGTPGDPGGPLRLPPSLAIARRLIDGWLTD